MNYDLENKKLQEKEIDNFLKEKAKQLSIDTEIPEWFTEAIYEYSTAQGKLSNEDKRKSVKIGVVNSAIITLSSLTMMIIIAISTVFAALHYNPDYSCYFLLALLSFVCCCVSIFFGCRGINRIRVNGYDGVWNIHSTRTVFDWQILLALYGATFFVINIIIMFVIFFKTN